MPIDAFVDTAIRTAFRIPGSSLDGIQCVYPQGRVTDRDLNSLIPEWMESEPCKHAPPPDEASDAESSDDEAEVDEGVTQDDGAEGGKAKSTAEGGKTKSTEKGGNNKAR